MTAKDMFSIPTGPLSLTLAGLLPFFAGAGAILFIAIRGETPDGAALALLVYAAVILSFLGGVRWGVEMTAEVLAGLRFSVLLLSVLGSIAGWALVLVWTLVHPAPWLFLIMAGALLAHWLWDVLSSSAMPAWFSGLRTIASGGAVLSLCAAWAGLQFVAG
ncbi:MAG: DUF3429 domain-containing protein [Pseudomonadota bacterium]